MKTNFIELMSGLFKDATPIQKWGFASFFAGKLTMLVASMWIVGSIAGFWFGVPIDLVDLPRNWIAGSIALYGVFIWVAVGVAIYDHYTRRLQKGHWEFENECEAE
jgi:hypothetical protein